jgi:glycosyltransferase involved in cell wall biosynthesis
MKKLPTISIVTCTLNPDLDTFKKSLESIRQQEYPKNLIEHIVVDGGSVDSVVEMAGKYGCIILSRRDLLREEQARQSIGFKKAKGQVLLILQSDNILTSKNWLRRMVEPFMQNDKIFCTFSAYNSFEKNMSTITRYTALFGAPHPMLYYLNKSDKIPLAQKRYNKGEVLGETRDYYVVKFNTSNLPTCGDNGHMILREAMNLVNKDSYSYTHLDAVMDLVDQGYETFGVVKNTIIHVGKDSVFSDVKRKVQLKSEFYDKRRGKRKYLVFDWQSGRDRINLLKYIIFSLTFVEPLFESLKGYTRIRDKAWFIHPIFCFLMLLGFGYSEIKWAFTKSFQRIARAF